jgi:hypothetical protein
MSNRAIHETRTKLLMELAETGRIALDFDPLAGGALAAIPNTNKYVAAGTLAGILSMAGKVMDEAAPAAQAQAELTDDQILDAVVHIDPQNYGLPMPGPDYVGYDLACARAIERLLRADSSEVRLTAVREARNEAQWISVSERLPEIPADVPSYSTYVRVLAVGASGWVSEMRYAVNSYAKTEKGRAPRWEESDGRLAFNQPTHWMPLPASPAASKEGDSHE